MTAPHWVKDAIFYHIYPLGLCDAPQHNDFNAAPVARLGVVWEWLDHIQALGANAVYIGPLFESTKHGYDTADYYQVDRRLGTNETMQALVRELKGRGLRVVLDAVFNHVGRDFWAFRDVQQHREQSAYRDWFVNVDFGRPNRRGDGFSYEGWQGYDSLVKLNLGNPAVRHHLFEAVKLWVEQFDIDGLRLDAADAIDPDFFRALRAYSRELRPDFWLLGEVVYGDYRQWANPDMLHATTNYECYNLLHSSHTTRDYHELAATLNRQFGDDGVYRTLYQYNFVDNHDVNRIASTLKNPAHLYPLYGLLFTAPGVPSVYYGSEWGIAGERTPTSDRMLRPALRPHHDQYPHPHLPRAIQRFAQIRRQTPALRYGGYRQLHVAREQLVFERVFGNQQVVVAVNAAGDNAEVTVGDLRGEKLHDLLNEGESFEIRGGRAVVGLYRHWLRIMQVE